MNTSSTPAPSSHWSRWGMSLGSIALMLALVHFWGGPFSPQPTLEQTVGEKVTAIREAAIDALKGQTNKAEPKQTSYDLDQIASITTAVLGGLAIILGAVGYVKHEPTRTAVSAGLLGGIAIGFQFAVVAVGMIIIALIIAAILHSFGDFCGGCGLG